MLVTAAIFYLFVILIVILYGWQPSISNGYYLEKVGNWFTGWAISVGVLLFITQVQVNPLVLFPSFGFIVVGLAPKFKSWQKTIHYLGAMFIILGGCAMVAYNDWFMGLYAAMLIGMFSLIPMKNRIFWIEIIAFTILILLLGFTGLRL